MQKLKGKRIARMVNDLEHEGVVISPADEAMLRALVMGLISGSDLLAHAIQFDDLSSYQDWLCSRLLEPTNASASEVSIEQLVREVADGFRRRHETSQAKYRQVPPVCEPVIAVLQRFYDGSYVPLTRSTIAA